MISALQSDHAAIHSAMDPRFARHCRRGPYAGVFALFMSGLSAPIGIRRQPRWSRVMSTKSEARKKRMIAAMSFCRSYRWPTPPSTRWNSAANSLVALRSTGAVWCGIWPRSKPGWPSAWRQPGDRKSTGRRIPQLALVHHCQQQETHPEPDRWQRSHIVELLEHHANFRRRQRPAPWNKCRDRGGADIVGGIGELLAVRDRKPVDLLEDVADMERRDRRSYESKRAGHPA